MSLDVAFLQTYSDKVVNFAVDFVSTKTIVLETVFFLMIKQRALP